MINSEIAQLRQQIEVEHASAVWALSGLTSGAAQHAFISRRMRHMEISYQGLKQLVGEEEAVEVLCEVFEKSPSQNQMQH